MTVGNGSNAANLYNGGFAIVGNAGKTFAVSNAATFLLSGTSGMVTGFNKSFGTTLPAPSNVFYLGSGTQSISAEAYGSLTIGGSGSRNLPASPMTIAGDFYMGGSTTTTAGAAVTINRDLSIDSGTTFAGGSFTHTVKGNWFNNGTFSASGAGKIVLNGTSTQGLFGATVFSNLEINNSAGVFFYNDNQTVNGTLTLTNGVIATGSNALIAGGTVARASCGTPSTSCFVSGHLQKPVATGSSTMAFETGSGSTYAPITNLAITGASAGGGLTGSSTAGQQPQLASSPISTSNYVNRYWTLTAGGGLTVTSYNVTFNFANPGDLVGSPNTSTLIVRKYNGSWTAPVSSSSTTSTVTGNGFTTFSDFAAGAASAPVLQSIAVTPANPTIAAGTNQQFVATGTYSDATTADLRAWSAGPQPTLG